MRSDQDTDLNFNLDGEVSTPELDSSTDINIDGDRRTGIIGGAAAAGAGALGGAAAAASGLFNRGRDEVDNADIDAPDLDTDLNVSDRVDDISADVASSVGEINAPNLDADLNDLELDTNIDTPNLELDTNIDAPRFRVRH